MAHALIGVIVQIDVRNFDFTGRQGFRVDTKTVILRGDFDLFRQQILYRMVRPVMAEFQFERLPAQGQPANLMPKANPENRDVADHFANVFDSVSHRFRIAWPVREEDAVRLHRQNVFCRSLRRHDVDFAIVAHK